jgi:hypothetical protein
MAPIHDYGYGANVFLPLVPKLLDLQASFLGGQGLGRYTCAGERM